MFLLAFAIMNCDHSTSPSGSPSGALATVQFRAATVALMGADPAPGRVIPVDACARQCMASGAEFRFTVTPQEALTHAAVAIDFYDAQGNDCAYAASPWAAIPPTTSFEVKAKGVTLYSCPYAGSFVPARAQMRLIFSSLARPGQATESFDIALPYSFTGPALSREATAPVVLAMEWDDNAGPTGGDKPIPGDFASYGCLVNDNDGDALTVDLSFQDVGGRCPKSACWAERTEVAARAFPRAVSIGTRKTHPADPFGLGFNLTCTVTDSHGLKTSRVEHFK